LSRLPSLILLCAVQLPIAFGAQSQSNAPNHSQGTDSGTSAKPVDNKAVAPKTMRMCIGPNAATDCATLTWAGDHYDGRRDNEVQPSSVYSITVWETDHVELAGKVTASALNGGPPVEGTFRGKISPRGGSLDDGVDDWRVGSDNSGTLPFTLTWSTDPSNVVAIAPPTDSQSHARPR
jgi:hypothetical protein